MFSADFTGNLPDGEILMAVAASLGNPALTRATLLSPVNKQHLTSRRAQKMTLCLCAMDSKSVGVGGDVFSVTSSAKSGVDYLGQSTKGDMNVKLEHLDAFGNSSLIK